MEVFRWQSWNIESATKHGCTIQEIESIVSRGGRGFPRKIGGGKFLIIRRGTGDRVVEVIFFRDPDQTVVVIHAMPLTTRRRRR